jgi:hypothetical protein
MNWKGPMMKLPTSFSFWAPWPKPHRTQSQPMRRSCKTPPHGSGPSPGWLGNWQRRQNAGWVVYAKPAISGNNGRNVRPLTGRRAKT